MIDPRVHCVVTNDDGVDNEGLHRLAAVAIAAGLDVVVAAPHEESSGSSAAMTAAESDGRIMISRRELRALPETPVFAVEAAPAFVVFTAVRGAFGPEPGVVLSGINRGPNTGTAVLHSGTVGAAMTAALAGVPAAAISLDVRDEHAPEYWETAEHVASQVLPALRSLRPGLVLNVNVPNVPLGGLRGIGRASLATGGAVQLKLLDTTSHYIQVTTHENADQPVPGTDSALLAAGYASVTPLLTVTEAGDERLAWLPAD